MDESKPGGLGPEEQKPESELPPELEQEKKEIYDLIEKQIHALREVTNVFDINIEAFSDNEDAQFREEYQRGMEWVRQQSKEREFRQIRFEMPGTGNVYFHKGWGQSYELEYPEILIRDLDCIILPKGVISVNDLTGEIDNAQELILSNQEDVAMGFFDIGGSIRRPDGYVRDRLHLFEGKISLLALKQKALDDEQVALFVGFIRSNKISIDSRWSLDSAIYQYCGEKKIDEAEFRKMIETEEDPKFSEARKLERRILAHLSKIYLTRIAYITHLAQSGEDSRIKVNSEKSNDEILVYKVQPGFQFTEEDAKKAKELNLPWSRIKKEIEEESAKE